MYYTQEPSFKASLQMPDYISIYNTKFANIDMGQQIQVPQKPPRSTSKMQQSPPKPSQVILPRPPMYTSNRQSTANTFNNSPPQLQQTTLPKLFNQSNQSNIQQNKYQPAKTNVINIQCNNNSANQTNNTQTPSIYGTNPQQQKITAFFNQSSTNAANKTNTASNLPSLFGTKPNNNTTSPTQNTIASNKANDNYATFQTNSQTIPINQKPNNSLFGNIAASINNNSVLFPNQTNQNNQPTTNSINNQPTINNINNQTTTNNINNYPQVIQNVPSTQNIFQNSFANPQIQAQNFNAFQSMPNNTMFSMPIPLVNQNNFQPIFNIYPQQNYQYYETFPQKQISNKQAYKQTMQGLQKQKAGYEQFFRTIRSLVDFNPYDPVLRRIMEIDSNWFIYMVERYNVALFLIQRLRNGDLDVILKYFLRENYFKPFSLDFEKLFEDSVHTYGNFYRGDVPFRQFLYRKPDRIYQILDSMANQYPSFTKNVLAHFNGPYFGDRLNMESDYVRKKRAEEIKFLVKGQTIFIPKQRYLEEFTNRQYPFGHGWFEPIREGSSFKRRQKYQPIIKIRYEKQPNDDDHFFMKDY